MTMPSKFHSQILPILLLLVAEAGLLIMGAEQKQLQPITLAGCPDKCGDISIPFPFGMKHGCFRPGFQVACNYSFRPPRAFFAANGEIFQRMSTQVTGDDKAVLGQKKDVELMDISVAKSEARGYTLRSPPSAAQIIRICWPSLNSRTWTRKGHSLCQLFTMFSPESDQVSKLRWWAPFVDSETSRLHALLPFRAHGKPAVREERSCSGQGCCVAALPLEAPPLTQFGVGFRVRRGRNVETNPCSYGMVVQSSWYNFSTPDLYGYEVLSNRLPRGVPVVLDFAIRNNGVSSCPAEGQKPPVDYACVSGNSSCSNAVKGYVCKCWHHYHGNPYIANGCQDVDECELRKQSHELGLLYPCSSDGICKNRVGGYDCFCKPGMKGDAKTGHCAEKFPLAAKVVVGLAAFAVVSVLVVMSCQLLKLKRFYEQNGGPVLKGVKNIRIYRKKQLKQITDNYKVVIGEGQFGKVYMGTLEDGQKVAIKISIKVGKDMKEFTDEVISQSEMRHKNIVRLLGCCLEVNVPMLVYEYAARGSLHDVLFGLRRIDSISVNTRLGIAVGSAEGLAYMHSAVESTICHGDVKSANILLDKDFTAKVSDFGTTRLLARGKSEKTELVIGDLSYIDPVYMEQGVCFTEERCLWLRSCSDRTYHEETLASELF